MRPPSALNLQTPSLHRTIATTLLRQLGYATVLEMSDDVVALRQMREAGGVHLLLCDLRVNPAARLDFLQAVARERLTHGVAIIGELAKGTWPALAKLLRLQGLQVMHLSNETATHDQMAALLDGFPRHGLDLPGLPTLQEIPSEHEVIAALSRGEIRPAMQPKFSLKTGGIAGFEVLARWQRAYDDILLPGHFLPALRRQGLLDALLFSLIDQAASVLQAYGGRHFHFAFNLEAAQLAQPGFAVRVSHCLARLGIDPRHITFELSEMGSIQMPTFCLKNLLRLRTIGCGLAIDDFGSDQSTLERLVELPFTEMKLNARFLDDLEENPRRRAVLSGTLALGRALGLPVVAQGVECKSQFQHLQQLGCEIAQGHYLCKPVMGHALTRLLHREAPGMLVENLPAPTDLMGSRWHVRSDAWQPGTCLYGQ
ncbi:EAL domain, c-di-GMP-specific phosphodiesterase class I (or its enzymatically inactive variant) [Pseudomonas delhiensis]|uniref:EAL domain, c-di-GMP-specific phosphodiesterase class I (Or its enzymatically inactive variant) n=1 Tax=Pseudomonas delhiensis TaxID=366289 RepID=A0A239KEL0_9PSED|nr:EAL domain-containing response regulator [Pseudomonas delhiensis]SDJ30335.1 EAL domain, c-di-GMP-specific phosphodiesterase class I (or its enzymatically inactive variant) [Pseudomonas delhiensis]SNT16083.1 EAL domain, c-di-GMP-specific phosphodiesterase class I (or its enzymatically inactive variant) [Pseudomonas delhiensis]